MSGSTLTAASASAAACRAAAQAGRVTARSRALPQSRRDSSPAMHFVAIRVSLDDDCPFDAETGYSYPVKKRPYVCVPVVTADRPDWAPGRPLRLRRPPRGLHRAGAGPRARGGRHEPVHDRPRRPAATSSPPATTTSDHRRRRRREPQRQPQRPGRARGQPGTRARRVGDDHPGSAVEGRGALARRRSRLARARAARSTRATSSTGACTSRSSRTSTRARRG